MKYYNENNKIKYIINEENYYGKEYDENENIIYEGYFNEDMTYMNGKRYKNYIDDLKEMLFYCYLINMYELEYKLNDKFEKKYNHILNIDKYEDDEKSESKCKC